MELGGASGNAVVHFHSSEQMTEVTDGSVKFLLGASVHLGKGVGWGPYRKLYQRVYVDEGLRVIRPDGVFLVIQTEAYEEGRVIPRYKYLLDLLLPAGWELIDERIWLRRKADHFQMPFSNVMVLRPPGGSFSRTVAYKASNDWFQGIWDYPQSKGGKINGYTPEFCRMLVNALTVKGDLIVDPFAGTGQLLAVAAKRGRIAVGYEIDPELVEVIRKRGCNVIREGHCLPAIREGLAVI